MTRGDKPLQGCWQVKPSALSPRGTPKVKSFAGMFLGTRPCFVPARGWHRVQGLCPLSTRQPPLLYFLSRWRVQCQPVTFVTPRRFLPCKLKPFFPPIWTDRTDSDSPRISCEPTAPLSRWTEIIPSLRARQKCFVKFGKVLQITSASRSAPL